MEDRFDVNLFINGMDAAQTDCEQHDKRLWVTHGGTTACLRYFGELPPSGAEAVQIYLTGDLPLGDIWTIYESFTPQKLERLTSTITSKGGIPTMMIARPGTFGSSGNHSEIKENVSEEAMLINAAIDAVKTQTGVRWVSLIGQSGGGQIAAYLLTQHDDLHCVALTSTPLSLKHAEANWDRPYSFAEYAAEFWDPLSNIGEIERNERLKITVISDKRDLIVPYDGAAAYVEAAVRSGLAARLIDGKATDKNAHGLTLEGFKAAIECGHEESAQSPTK